MKLFNKMPKGMPDEGRMRYELVRNIYSTIISQCYRDAYTKQAYKNLAPIASETALKFANEMIKKLKHYEAPEI